MHYKFQLNPFNHNYFYYIPASYIGIRRRGVVRRVPAFQLGGLGKIPGEVRIFNLFPEIGCVSFVFCPVLPLAVALTLC